MALTGAIGLAAVFAAGCSGGTPIIGKKDAAPATVTITPADGTGKVKPEDGITVKAGGGKLTSVVVQYKGKDVKGTMSADGTTWKADRNLQPDASYTVSATAANADAKTTTATSAFKTLEPADTFGLQTNIPWSGQTVGVGMPIVITFTEPIKDKKAVESSLKVQSDKPAEGAWLWYGDSQVIFRTKDFWEPHQKVKVTGNLAGVKSGKDTYGTKDFTINFKIGTSSVSTVNTRTHRMVVKIDGKKVRDVGISAGKATEYKYTTTSGIHVTMDKKNPETMVSPGIEPGEPGYYKETVPYAVRISYSGEYVHSAPWSVSAQGNSNVSHGCVNAPPEFAQWYYNESKWGDIVTVTGTDRELEYDNGYGYWQKSWKDWVLGSAFDESVTTGPDGAAPDTAAETPAADQATPTTTPAETATP